MSKRLSLEDRFVAYRARVAERDTANRSELAELVADSLAAGHTVQWVADRLGSSRQRLYKLGVVPKMTRPTTQGSDYPRTEGET